MGNNRKEFIVMPENCNWYVCYGNRATTLETVYRSEKVWFATNRRIAIRDTETNETAIFAQSYDENGNLIIITQ